MFAISCATDSCGRGRKNHATLAAKAEVPRLRLRREAGTQRRDLLVREADELDGDGPVFGQVPVELPHHVVQVSTYVAPGSFSLLTQLQ